MLLCALTSVVIALPFFWLGSASGHDFEFHAASWMDVASQWKDGIFYPHWTKWTNHGFGEPRFIFYPPASWLLGAALSLLVSWNHVPVVIIILSQTFAGLSAFGLVRRMVDEKYAIFAAVCYAANPNALLMVYFRSDYAELWACAFFPLVVLCSLELGDLLKSRTRLKYRALILFALSLAAVWLSNAPAGVIVSYSAAGLFLWAALSQRKWKPLLHGGAALALGLGIAGFYLLPAAYEQKWVNISQALSTGLSPIENFLFTKVADAEHTAFNAIASTIALGLLVVTALAAATVKYQNYRKANNTSQKTWTALMVLAAAAGLLMFPITIVIWQHLPKLRFVQFPWRFMSILSVCYACLVAGAMARRFAWLWLSVVIAGTCATGIFLVKHTWWDADDMTTLREAVEQGDGFDGTDEYDPRGDDHLNLPLRAPLAQALPREEGASLGREVSVQTQKWTTNEKQVYVNTPEPIRLALRVLNYPAWRVEVNGKTVRPESADDFAQMIIPLEPGESQIKVSFARTRDRTAGMILSAASILLMLVLATRSKK
ncbi:MAG TPA: 6-pyruvoyl-tetrahydropterin synthase-related protein [Candidatus Eremiobacteraceae bacterium]|nr:6-pyruvoyl-tetrahydropterin synthase-related protein [Candidatus Eremiobacteraceae bacterium]